MYQREMHVRFCGRYHESDRLEASLQETDEDHLGVTLIRFGDSVTIEMRLELRAVAVRMWQAYSESESGWNHDD